jgi:hypothetical protein
MLKSEDGNGSYFTFTSRLFCRWSRLAVDREGENCLKSACFYRQPGVTSRLSGLIPQSK